MRRVQLRGGARWPHARRTLCTLSVRSRAPTKQMGPYHRSSRVYDSPVADPLVSRLLDPAIYPHEVDRVELVETHISWVFLAGERVYKVKKPVNLGFLDFTTLARRRHFCHEEVRLNRRLAPDVYLDVMDIKGTRRAPRFGGAGRAIEVAVLMRRLPAERMLESLVKGDAAPPEPV